MLQRVMGNEAARLISRGGGVVHVTSVYDFGGEELRTILIGRPTTPKSQLDWFLLNYVRSCADAVLITGKILSDEPFVTSSVTEEFRLELGEIKARARNLGDWVDPDPRLKLLLTNNVRLFESEKVHPYFTTGGEYGILTSSIDVADRAVPKFNQRTGLNCKVHQLENANIGSKIRAIADETGVLSVEAGPSVSNQFYALERPVVDIVALSRYNVSNAEQVEDSIGSITVCKSTLNDMFEIVSEKREDNWEFSVHCRKGFRL
jgi:hypothetical protein